MVRKQHTQVYQFLSCNLEAEVLAKGKRPIRVGTLYDLATKAGWTKEAPGPVLPCLQPILDASAKGGGRGMA
jgi:hypothetical protein